MQVEMENPQEPNNPEMFGPDGLSSNMAYPDLIAGCCHFSRPGIEQIAELMFQSVRDIIKNGQVGALLDLEKEIDFSLFAQTGTIGPEQLRDVKDLFMAFCTLQFHCAVEAGLPRRRMLSLADQQIAKVMRMNQLQDVLNQMKASVAAFTYAVYLDLVSRHKASIEAIQHELMSAISVAEFTNY